MADRSRPTTTRFTVLILLATAATSAYMTRGLGAANTSISREFAVSNEAMGAVLAAFNLGYFLCQVPGGMIASRYGVRGALALMAIGWSLCTVASSLAGSPQGLERARIALGLAQAGLVPCIAKVIADWFPLARRGFTSAVIAAAMQLGSIAASGLTASLLDPLGWRRILQCYAVLGVGWSAVFWFWFRNSPADHPRANDAERELISSGRSVEPGQPPASTANQLSRIGVRMISSLAMWAFCAQAFFRAYAYELYSTWFPALLEKGYDVPPEKAGWMAAAPTTAILVGSLAAGWIVDLIYQQTRNAYWSRCGAAICGMALAAMSFVVSLWIRDPVVMVTVVAVGAFFSALGNPATWAAAMDLGGRLTPVVVGVMNMAGTLGAYYCPRHIGRLFDHVIETGENRWDLVLLVFAGVNLAAGILWIFVNPRQSLDSTAAPGSTAE